MTARKDDFFRKSAAKSPAEYAKTVPAEHLRHFGQYFTNPSIARFMCAWACQNARTMLDPAAGNSVFLCCARKQFPSCALTGYEIDPTVLDYFGNPASARIFREDYLHGDWDLRYDAIVCNPPYGRFQAVSNRSEVLRRIQEHTGQVFSPYTNLSILFLIKSICQMAENGRLCYLIPSEFLNSSYGTPVKKMLLEKKLLRALINFPDDAGMFFRATTTCCILMLDKTPKQEVLFYHLRSVEELEVFSLSPSGAVRVPYGALRPEEKWRPYLCQEQPPSYKHLRNLSDFCAVSRGIATGANDFFCFSLEKALKYGVPEHCLTKCVCRSSDVAGPFFTEEDFQTLSRSHKTVYVLDAAEEDLPALSEYLRLGEEAGVPQKYLPSRRRPWFSMEQKPPAPIWVSSACRKQIKFVRNLAKVRSLTTFHSLFVREPYLAETDLIFCYFLTSAAQEILRQNRKVLGNHLDKFQPNDLNSAKMLDISLVTPGDKARVLEICRQLREGAFGGLTEELESIFAKYLDPCR